MTVVERCPNCGTTQATSGECEACHEAQVRYFCTNHEPGIWLAGPSCPQCAARAAPPPRAPPVTVTTAATAALPPDVRPAADARASSAKRPRPVDDAALDVRPARPPLWETLLRSTALTRGAAPERDPASLSPASGWLMALVRRLALIAVLLVVALGLAVYLVARSLH